MDSLDFNTKVQIRMFLIGTVVSALFMLVVAVIAQLSGVNMLIALTIACLMIMEIAHTNDPVRSSRVDETV